MKKIFLFAVAAMVSLSSCVQTSEFYTGKVEEMGFKSAVTRNIIQTNGDMTYPISVSATWDNPTVGKYVPYFENNEFVYDNGLWKGNPAKYWPTSGKMQFLAVCPFPKLADVTPAYKLDGTFETLTFGAIDNNLMEQHDVLYSDLLAVVAPQTSEQPLLFHHAYAQLNVTFQKTNSAAEVVLKSVTAKNVNLNGTLTITPALKDNGQGDTSTAAWSNTSSTSRYFLPETPTSIENGTLDKILSADVAYSPTPIVVIPGTQTVFVIVYTIDGVEHTYTHTLTGQWEMGYKYTYNYTINVNEIIFNCTVEDWKAVDGGSVTI